VKYTLRLHFLDSDCTIIEHPSDNLTMVDMGTTRRSNPVDYYCRHFFTYSQGRRRPRQLFRFIATHPDMDHISGLAELFARVPVVNFWYVAPGVEKPGFDGSPYREEDWDAFQRAVSGVGLSVNAISPKAGQAGRSWTGDGIHIWAPSPEDERVAEETNRPNLASYVLAIQYGRGLVVLGGDAEAATWQRLYEKYAWPPGMTVTVIKAPHHGHDTAYFEPILTAMRPRLTILTPDGDREHDGSRLYERHSRVLRTDRRGNIVVTVSPSGNFTYRSDRPSVLTSPLLAPPLPQPLALPPRPSWLDSPRFGEPALPMPPWPPHVHLP
jgi:beta-lactamase superfamily II metal-dependent hydrolase